MPEPARGPSRGPAPGAGRRAATGHVRGARPLTTEREVARLREVYSYYDRTPSQQRKRDRANPGNLAILRERERVLASALLAQFGDRLSGLAALDVGCGRGEWLRWLSELGLPPARMLGIDLLPERVAAARDANPDMRFECLNAEEIAEPAGSFDLVVCSTLFSSILDPGMRAAIAGRVTELLAPGGAVLWYDFRYRNPGNPHTWPIRLTDLVELFPKLRPQVRPLTLVPPLARRLGPATRALYPLLAALPPLRGHLGGLLRGEE